MKAIIYTASLLLSSSLMTFASNQEKEVQQENKEVTSQRYQYDKDWENIKKAIIEGDEKELQNWISGDGLSANDVIFMFKMDKEALNALKKTSYKELESTEMEGETLLEFSFSQSGKDDEGNTYESALFLYLKQGDPNLTVHNILAAG